ncbi:hypothetical protein L7F22_001030 [Adiantum nelumboides]|nr:hypothetical protein [Adiantum nelumboides]
MKRDDHVKWEKAMKSEMDSLHKNDTWELVSLLKEKALFCFQQERGIDFDEMFLPVLKMTTLRMVLGLVAHEDMELGQMDVKTAFLHGDLHEDIYIEQPVGHAVKGKEHLVCKLKKILYGLKQTPSECAKAFQYGEGKSSSTPLAPHLKLSRANYPKSDAKKTEMAKVSYASACGNLMYVMVTTKPYTAFVVGVVGRFMSNPEKKHWEAVKEVLRYLAGTKDKCICFGKGNLSVVEYIDADIVGDLNRQRSTSAYLYTFVSDAISWFSRLQSCVTLSTTEAEYAVVSESCKEIIWFTRLVGDLGIVGEITVLHCDNQSAVQLARNPVFHAKTKHVDVRHHFIIDVLEGISTACQGAYR